MMPARLWMLLATQLTIPTFIMWWPPLTIKTTFIMWWPPWNITKLMHLPALALPVVQLLHPHLLPQQLLLLPVLLLVLVAARTIHPSWT
jgi:hypothetical protein